nr:adenylate/guanylate cyclase domain-containing protein [Acidimicrobiia bacterium]
GDTVNLAQRLQEMARPGGRTILSEATWEGLTDRPAATANPPELVKGRSAPVTTYLIERDAWSQT